MSVETELLTEVAQCIDEGDSINVAMQRVVGKSKMSGIAKQLRAHPMYTDLLNKYMAKIGRTHHFILTKHGLKTLAEVEKLLPSIHAESRQEKTQDQRN